MGSEPAEIVPAYDCPAVDFEESQMEQNLRCHRALHENLCRNKMLQYFAQMRRTEKIFEAMLWDLDFRQQLHNQCSQTLQVLPGFPFYEVEMIVPLHDELENALTGLSLVQNSEDGSGSSFGEGLDEYMVIQPNFWTSADASSEFVFNEGLLVPDEAVNIDGEYSYDLDLFYTSQDVVRLFNYFYKDYLTICDIALQSFQIGDSDEDQTDLMQLNDALMGLEYNYLSEDVHVRDILYNVCALNQQMTLADQKLFHDSREAWNNLFN